MALSRIVAFGDGSTTQFAIPFALGYIRRSDITCRVGTEQDGAGNPIYRTMTFISDELVDISGTPPANGERVEFTRTVDRANLLVDYEDGDIINEENMNIAQKQAIMLVHETLDGRFEQFQSDVDAGGFRITGLGAGVNPADAVTLQQLADASFGSPLVIAPPDESVTYEKLAPSLRASLTPRTHFNTAVGMAGILVDTAVNLITVTGWSTTGQGPGQYRRVASEPSHSNKFQSAGGVWWELVSLVSTPASAGKPPVGTVSLSESVILGPPGSWDEAGATKRRPTWVVGVDQPAQNVAFYSIGLTGHYMHPNSAGSVIYGGRPAYYSAILDTASLSHVAGKDNLTTQISSTMFTDHSDIFKDAVNNQGDHAAIVGGAYHVAAGNNTAIMGGSQTQVWGDNAFMGGGRNNIIGDPARSTAEQAFSAVIGGTNINLNGQYNTTLGGLNHVLTRTSSFSGVLAGWNHAVGDTATRGGMAAVGGRDGRVTADNSVLLGGARNTVATTGAHAVAMGNDALADVNFMFAQGGGKFSTNDVTQVERHVWRGEGAGTVVPGAGGVGGTSRPMPVGCIIAFEMLVVGARTDLVGEYFAYKLTGLATNPAGVASVVQTTTVIHETDPSFNAAAEIFGSSLGIRITGNASKTVRWAVETTLIRMSIL